MGRVKPLRCPKCGSEPASKTIFSCASCERILEVNVEVARLTRAEFQTMRS